MNRHIQESGLVSPERAKNVVWCFFRKYNCKKLQGRDDNLKLAEHPICMICLTDPTRHRHCTVKMGKDNSPSSLLDHMRIHHLEEFNSVVLVTIQGVSLTTFTSQRKEPRVRELIGNSSPRESADKYPDTTDVTQNAGNTAGQYITHANYTNPVNLEDSPLVWWKQHLVTT